MTFCPRWVRDLAAEVPEAPSWLVHHLLPNGTLALLAAYPKVGKSTLAYQLAVAVAQGRNFLGRPTSQGGVLIIVAEERRDDAVRRLREFGMSEADPICLWTEAVTDNAAERQDMLRFIQEQTIALVIVDTFATYLMIQDETNNSLVTIRLKPYLDMVHATGTTILFIHHERKNRDEGNDDTKAIRGGGAILGLVDISFQLQKTNGGSASQRRLKIVGRYQETPRVLQLDYEDDGYVSVGTPEDHRRAAQTESVLTVLPAEGIGFTVKETMAATGFAERPTRRILEDLHSEEKLHRTGEGKRGDPLRYRRIDHSAAAEPTEAKEGANR